MTSKKRKYGDLSARPLPSNQNDLLDDVFAAFTGPRPQAAETLTLTDPPPSTSPSTSPSTPPRSRPSSPPSRPSHHADVSPKRDFQKVANSITRDAVPAGIFNGKAKQLYDCLYSLTRGAISPSMSVRIARSELMLRAGIGAKVTLEQNLRRLTAAGLVRIKTIGGIQGGNEYTVYLPEEISPPSTPPSTGASPPGHPSGGEKLAALGTLETSYPSHGSTAGESTVSGGAKTSFKTKDQSDDEPAALADVVRQLEKELTGKNSAKSEQWRELGEVLAAEMRIAAARTTVSNVPAFMAEHLRRRLWKLDKKQAREQGRELPDQAPASPVGDAAPAECLDCKGSGWWYPEGPDKGVAKCRHTQVN